MRAMLFLLATTAASVAGPTAFGEIAGGRWVKLDERGGGVRRGSAMVYLAAERKFLVLGGGAGNQKLSIAAPPAVQTFDPIARKWEDIPCEVPDPDKLKDRRYDLLLAAGQGRLWLNPSFDPQCRSAWDPEGRGAYLIQTANRLRPERLSIARFDVAKRQWELLSTTKPPAKADGLLAGEWGPATVFMEGVAVVYDPVNAELLFLGGRTGNAADGFVGHWAFSPAKKAWRRLEQPSATLDPLRAKCLAAHRLARDAMAAARNVYYAGLEPAARAEAVRDRPAKLLAAALDAARAAAEAVAQARPQGWEAEAVSRAKGMLTDSIADLSAAARQLAGGTVDARGLKGVFDAAWRLDEAADELRGLPGERMHAAAAYDPANRCVVLYGGDHGDYLMSDTWLYDCAARTWRRAFPRTAPPARRAAGRLVWLPECKRLALVGGETYVPKFIYFRRYGRPLNDLWTFDSAAGQWSAAVSHDPKAAWPTLTCQVAAGPGDVVLGLASEGRYPAQWDATTWMIRVGDLTGPAGRGGLPPGTRTYLSLVQEYDPCWYDAAGPGDPRAVAARLAGLKPNTWTAVPRAPRPAPQRDWGTAVFDPHRDQFYHWTGGHMADPASIVSTYHVGVGRWSIPYVAEYFGKGIGFNGRPDCMNHTYLNYAYDPVSRKLVCTSLAGTSVYDPDRRDFQPRIDQPFRQHPYYTKTVSTPRGVVCWERDGYLGVLDVAGRTWKKLPVAGTLPPVVHGDENAIAYDAKRDVLWMMAADGYQKLNGQVWRYEMNTGAVVPMDPAGRETIGVRVRPRESVYLPKQDLVLYNAFADDRQIAYDPAGNRWVTLAVARTHKTLDGRGVGLMYDPRRDLVWAMDGGQRMFVLRLDGDAVPMR